MLSLTISKIEHHFDSAMPVLLTADEEGIAILVKPEAMGYQPRRFDSFLRQQAQVNLHGVQRLAFEVLDSKGIRSNQGNLFEVEGRPLEPRRLVHTGYHDRRPWLRYAHPNLERLRGANRVVDHVNTP